MPTIVVTGGPGAGKTTVSLAVAPRRPRCAVIDVDDVRQMLKEPHVAPWGGEEGRRQQELGVLNSCALAANFAHAACDVVIADVLTNETAALYRRLVSDIVIVRLKIDPEVALQRAAARHFNLTREEFDMLHSEQASYSSFDVELDSGTLEVEVMAGRLCDIFDRVSR